MCPLLEFKPGLQCYQLLWTGCRVNGFKTLHTDASLNRDIMLSILHCEHSKDPDLHTLEEWVKGNFEAYVVELNKIEVAAVLDCQ